MRARRRTIGFWGLGALLAPWILADVAHATITTAANGTSALSCSATPNNTNRFCGFAATFSTPNTGTTFTSRYAMNVNADVSSGTQDLTGTATHNLSFSAAAVGGYRIDIVTTRIGDLNRVSDGGNANAGIGALTGSSNIALSSGSLSLADLGDIGTGNFNTTSPFSQSTTATIFRVSNGVTQNHVLTFSWAGTVRSNTSEAAVRVGLANGSTTSCTACEYPGSPARTIGNDGQFVTVTFTSLCGNGTIDASVSEQCDEGVANGTAGSCCNANCTLKSSGTSCRASAGVCDVEDFCTGSSGACPTNFVPNGTVCRPGSGDVCDPDEACDGASVDCPADAVKPSGFVCNPGSGDMCDPTETCSGNPTEACPADNVTASSVLCRAGSGDMCDPDEYCTGIADQACPSDTVASAGTVCNPGSGDLCDIDELCSGTPGVPCTTDSPAGAFTVCRPGSGDMCDPDEFCPGVADQPCPPDVVTSAGTVCRAEVAGGCDLAESCTGAFTAPCPTDTVVSAGTECRASAGICDIAEQCDGVANTCPSDSVAPNTTSCRTPAGVCDAEEFCTGSSVSCPADAKLTNVCRAVADICDVAESCDGVNDNCPANGFQPATVQCRAAGAACDTAEFCTGSSVVCPADTTTDGDGDSIGDGCDPCNNIVPVYAVKPSLKIKHLLSNGGVSGNDSFKYTGTITVPTTPTIDPLAKGARILIKTVTGAVILDSTIPGGPPIFGAGWTANAAHTTYLYRNRGLGVPTVNGVTKFKLKIAPGGKLSFNVKGKYNNYPVAPGALPLMATIVIDSPVALTGQCGEASWQSTVQNPGSCTRNSSGSSVKCR